MRSSIPCLVLWLHSATGFVAQTTTRWSSSSVRPLRLPSSLQSAATDATEALSTSQAAFLAELQAAVPELGAKPANSWPAGAGESVAGAPAVLEAFDAPGPPNVAWVSSLKVEGKISSLTILNGPLTDVPHFVSRVNILDDDTMSLFVDWRPRAYGAYEMIKPDGSYPGPEEIGRDAFTYSGARLNMEKKFFTEEFTAAIDGAKASLLGLGGSVDGSGPVNKEDALTRGPQAVELKGIPLTPDAIAAVAALRATAAKFWLGWQGDVDAHAHRPGAQVNSQYVFDTPAKQNMYTALLAKYSALYGDDGVKLAAADSGPLDEGYVGGGS